MLSWGGLLPENGVWVCASLKTPFLCPHGWSQDPHFSIFQFLRPYFHPKSHISRNVKLQSLKISKKLSSKVSNWAKIQFKRLHFVKKFSLIGSQIRQRFIHKPLCIALKTTHLYQQPIKEGRNNLRQITMLLVNKVGTILTSSFIPKWKLSGTLQCCR